MLCVTTFNGRYVNISSKQKHSNIRKIQAKKASLHQKQVDFTIPSLSKDDIQMLEKIYRDYVKDIEKKQEHSSNY